MKYMLLFTLTLSFFACPVHTQAQCGTTGDTIFIESSAQLADLQGCTAISGSLFISDGDLESLSDLQSLTSIEEHLILDENISLLSLEGLESLQHIGGDFKLISNFTLQNISNLGALSHIGGDIYLESNLGIDNLDGLQGLDSLHGSFEIFDNPTIQSLDGFDNISYVAGDFILNELQDELEDLTALSSLLKIDGSLEIYLQEISNLEGLDNLAYIGQDLRIDGAFLLFNVDGLEGLSEIGGDLIIVDNASLLNLTGLSSLNSIEGNVNIAGNGGLSNCCSLKPLMVEDPPAIGGTVTIENNAVGCNSEAEVLECIIDNITGNEHPKLSVILEGGYLVIESPSAYRLSFLSAEGRLLNHFRGEKGQMYQLMPVHLKGLIFIDVVTDEGIRVTRKFLID